MSELIGPALPPGYSCQTNSEDDLIGPLPSARASVDPQPSGSGSFGPQLPPELITSDENPRPSSAYGPSLPPEWAPDLPSCGPTPPAPSATSAGRDEQEDDLIGPMPLPAGATVTSDLDRKKAEVESRSQAMKGQLMNKDRPPGHEDAPRREEWMTELPPDKKPSGIGARKFRTTAFDPGDRSVWTDTPVDRERKAKEEETAGPSSAGKKKKRVQLAPVSSRDREMAEKVEEYNKNFRSESLMEVHRKRRAAEGGVNEDVRIPFNRETDLELPQTLITPAKRQALMKDSARSLGSKFTHGKQTYL